MDKIDQFIADIENEKIQDEGKRATVGDVKASERKILINTYKTINEYQKQNQRENQAVVSNVMSEVRTISTVLEGYFTRTNEFLTRIEKQIKKNNSENKKIKKDFKYIKSQVDSLKMIQ